MVCNKCGAQFDGEFCNRCGAKNKKKKPFFLRWWFILAAIIAIFVIALSLSGDDEELVWSDIVLGEMLPEPPVSEGKIQDNTAEGLWVSVRNLTDKQYADYIDACKGKGFTTDAVSDSYSYSAYNAQGYKLQLTHYGNEFDMDIRVEPPLKMEPIIWPAGVAGKKLPTPKSTVGSFSYEREDGFSVYVGNTTKADFSDYINACSDKGFTVDYNKGETGYSADDAEGWHVNIQYVGNNVMCVRIEAPAKESTTIATTTTATTTADTDALRSEFKAAMDSYETFMNDYVAFMKRYKDNPGDLEILADYADYLKDYNAFVKDFNEWEGKDLNTAELAYYLEVQTRVSKKLLDASL